MVGVQGLGSAVTTALCVLVVGTVGSPQDFARRGRITAVPHLLMPMVASGVTLGRVFKSLE